MGSSAAQEITLECGDDLSPTFSEEGLVITGEKMFGPYYIQGVSSATMMVNGANCYAGAHLRSVRLVGNGKELAQTYSSGQFSGVALGVGVLNTEGDNAFTAELVDSRGLTAEQKVTVTVVTYTPITITSAQVGRIASEGA